MQQKIIKLYLAGLISLGLMSIASDKFARFLFTNSKYKFNAPRRILKSPHSGVLARAYRYGLYVCMFVRMYVCMHVCMCVCMYVRMHGCTYVCMYQTWLYMLSNPGIIELHDLSIHSLTDARTDGLTEKLSIEPGQALAKN